MLPELQLEPIGEYGSAPPGPPLGSEGEDSIGSLPDGFTAARRVTGGGTRGTEVDSGQGLVELGRVDLLLSRGLPFDMVLFLKLLLELSFLLLPPFGRVTGPVCGGDGVRDQRRGHLKQEISYAGLKEKGKRYGFVRFKWKGRENRVIRIGVREKWKNQEAGRKRRRDE